MIEYLTVDFMKKCLYDDIVWYSHTFTDRDFENGVAINGE